MNASHWREQQAVVAALLQPIGRAAVAALHDELALAPKPGLVSFIDSGSHSDMNAQTFMRSLFALRHAFAQMAALGAQGSCGASFSALQRAGMAAEVQMLRATAGVNTHRGAIFTLGLLCASAGALAAAGQPLHSAALRHTIMACWGPALRERDAQARDTHGSQVARTLGLRGANAEAASGFPVLFEVTIPALRAALRSGAGDQQARLQAFFHTMAVLDDTNLAHRGGLQGLRDAQAAARAWLAAGCTVEHAQALHREFVARRLSPGGSADLLAAACWALRVCGLNGL